MFEDDNQEINKSESTVQNEIVVKSADLSRESLEIINSIIDEKDAAKANSLTDLFNANQKKKTIVRVNKLNELLDTITDTTIERFNKRPDEISNQEILQALKIIQDLAEKNQKQLTDSNAADKPLIQINQQNNEVNVGGIDSLDKASRDRVKNAMAAILAGISAANAVTAEAEVVDTVEEDNNND